MAGKLNEIPEENNKEEKHSFEGLSLREDEQHLDTEPDGKPEVVVVSMTSEMMNSALPPTDSISKQRSGNQLLD